MTLQSLAYLASPYTNFPDGIEAAFIAASKITARLIQSGVRVFSPIVHAHPIAMHGHLDPLDHRMWMEFDQAMMNVCDVLIVAHLPRWDQSKGVAMEIAFFEKRGRSIFDLDPEKLTMTLRRT